MHRLSGICSFYASKMLWNIVIKGLLHADIEPEHSKDIAWQLYAIFWLMQLPLSCISYVALLSDMLYLLHNA